MKTHIFCILTGLFLSLGALAQTFKFEGINYNITSDSTVEVVSMGYYTGDITIPYSVVDYNGRQYSVTKIGNSAFYGDASVTSIIFPAGLTSIGNKAFVCTGLTSLSLPNGLISIGDSAFQYCETIRGIITFGDSLVSIGNDAFSQGPQLDVIICKSETPPSISSTTFDYTPEIVLVPQSAVAAYKSAAVWSQYNILAEKRVIVENLTEGALSTTIIDKGYGPLSSITHLTVSGALNEVDIQSMKDMSLMELDISNTVLSDHSLPDSAFFDKKILFNITLPTTLENIGNYAFWNLFHLTSITFPDGLNSIGDYAFSNCYDLTSITFPDGLTSIGNYAFSSCSGLTSLILPDGLTSIGDDAFRYCRALTSVTFPAGLTSIGNSAFWYCESLKKIVVQSLTPPTGPSNAFEGIPSDCHLSLPKNTSNSYLTSTLWSSFQKVSEIQRDYKVMKGESISLYGTTPVYPVENIRYVWEPSIGLSDSTVAYPVFTADTSRQYKLTVYLNHVIYDIDSVFVKVTEKGDSVSVQTLCLNPIVKQSPSPFESDFQFEIALSAPAPVKIQVMDLFGQIIHFDDPELLQAGTHQRSIQAANWPAGMYLYQVKIGETVHAGKMLKR